VLTPDKPAYAGGQWHVEEEAPATSLWRRFPMEILDLVASYSSTMTEEEAKGYRLDLMQERTIFVDVVDRERFGQEFHMW
jgi:hypothetical protein